MRQTFARNGRTLNRATIIATCVWLLGSMGLLHSTAKADSTYYLNQMLNNQPDVLADPYVPQISSSQIDFTNYTDTLGDETIITILDGPGSTGLNSYYDSLSITINPGSSPTGSISQSINDGGPDDELMFSGTLIAYGTSTQTGSSMIPYWFLFQQNVSTFYAPAGDLIGGLVTNLTGDPLVNGAEVQSDIKEYVFVAPLPGIAQSGFILLGGLAAAYGYRRVSARLS